MISLNRFDLTCRSIDQAHFQIARALFHEGQVYVNERGSYVGHKRLEFDFVTLHLTHPHEDTVPILPEGVPAVSTLEGNINYAAKYLLDGNPAPNEQYTYGLFIMAQMDDILNMLRDTPQTNQAVFCIGNGSGPERSVLQSHPPCLRSIDCRMDHTTGALHLITYWRSWDAWAGLPENLGGIQYLQAHMANELSVDTGELIACSKGLHLYDYQWPFALQRLGGVMPDGSIITEGEARLGEGWMPLPEGE